MAARDARDAGELDRAQAAAEAKRLGAQVDKPIAGRTVYPPNRRLLGNLGREWDVLFTFVSKSEVQATNWRAEHAIRPAVVCRKAWVATPPWRAPVSPARRSSQPRARYRVMVAERGSSA